MISSSSCKQLDYYTEELWRISKFKQVDFSLRQNVVIFPTDIKLTGSEFRSGHSVSAATEKVPTSVLTLGTNVD